MKINSYSLAASIFILLFGGISFTSAMNWWQTESTKTPAKYSEGTAAGQYNPADIRGSYTFGEVSNLFEIPLADLQKSFRLPEDSDPASYSLKSLEEQFAGLPVEMGTGSVRMFVAFYNGLPYELSTDEDTYLFPEAAEVVQAQGKLSAEQAAYLKGHIVEEMIAETPAIQEPEPAVEATAAVEVEITPAPTEHAAPDKTITGKTTFQNLLDWGVSQAEIEQILGESMPAPVVTIKDYLAQKGLEFSTYKTKLQDAVDE